VVPDRATWAAAAATLHHPRRQEATTKRAIRPSLPVIPAPWRRPPPACISTRRCSRDSTSVRRRSRLADAARRCRHLPAGARAAAQRAPHARRALRDSARHRRRHCPHARPRRQGDRGRNDQSARPRSGGQHGELRAGAAETDIFITPGYEFRVVDRLITNFHLPKSTLLMLVSAFAGLGRDPRRVSITRLPDATVSSAMATPCC
jgi:hypothetical protein